MKKTYDFSNGYFGEKGQGRSMTRHISSSNPIATSKDFYNKATYGGIETLLNNGKGLQTNLADGTVITYRIVSSSDGSPAVNISIRKSVDNAGVKKQKIHFVK